MGDFETYDNNDLHYVDEDDADFVPEKKLRVLVVSQRANSVVRGIIGQSLDIVGIVESAPRSYQSGLTLFQRLRFMTRVAMKPLRSLGVLSTFKSIPYMLFHQGNGPELEAFVAQAKPDLIIVYSMSQLLPRSVFDAPRLGTVNLHPSLLPSYRGADPWFWVYYCMEPETGVTMHFIDAGEDTGDIIYQAKIPMPMGVPLDEAQTAAEKAAGRLVMRLIKDLNKGYAIDSYPQPEKSPTMQARRVPRKEYADLIDLKTWSVERVWHMLNGLPDWIHAVRPKGGFLARTMRWHLNAYGTRMPPAAPAPGTIVKTGPREYTLYCKDGWINYYHSVSPTHMIRGLFGL